MIQQGLGRSSAVESARAYTEQACYEDGSKHEVFAAHIAGQSHVRRMLMSDDVVDRVADVLEQMDGLDIEVQARAVLNAVAEGEGDDVHD